MCDHSGAIAVLGLRRVLRSCSPLRATTRQRSQRATLANMASGVGALCVGGAAHVPVATGIVLLKEKCFSPCSGTPSVAMGYRKQGPIPCVPGITTGSRGCGSCPRCRERSPRRRHACDCCAYRREGNMVCDCCLQLPDAAGNWIRHLCRPSKRCSDGEKPFVCNAEGCEYHTEWACCMRKHQYTHAVERLRSGM